MKEMLVDDIVAYSYMPNELRAKGISLAFGLLMAVYHGKTEYEFDILKIQPRQTKGMIDKEPLVYKDQKRLVIKELCTDIQRYMNGVFEYVYVQMKNPKTQQIVGAAFWNERPEVCTFHVVYEDGKNDQEKDILEFVDEVYKNAFYAKGHYFGNAKYLKRLRYRDLSGKINKADRSLKFGG